MKICIAGLALEFASGNLSPEDFVWASDFMTRQNDSSSHITFAQAERINILGSEIYREQGISWSKTETHYFVSIFDSNNDCIACLQSDITWQHLKITKTHRAHPGAYKTLSEIAFRTLILFHSGIVIHASSILYHGIALLFTAPSGVGKSTQANLWAKYEGAEILNADRPALRIENNNVVAYGTPWSGSTNSFSNQNAPLKAIFVLEQSPVNSVTRLAPAETLSFLLARCYLPYFDEGLMELALKNMEEIIRRTPVYILRCTPDKKAVDTVKSFLSQ